MALGVDTFGDVTADAAGRPRPHAQVIRDVVAQGVLAEVVGLDFIGVGEHHRDDFSVSAPDVGGPVSWQGRTRPALDGQRVYPAVESGELRTWVGVGGSPKSVVRAARYGLPLMLAIIGGEPLRFRPLVDLYHRATDELGKQRQRVGTHSPGYVAATDAQARDELWLHYRAMHARIGRERGWAPMTREQFDLTAGPDGALFVGSPETVAAKIVKVMTALELSRFDLKYSAGTLPHEQLMTTIGLYGREVAPAVREQLKTSTSTVS